MREIGRPTSAIDVGALQLTLAKQAERWQTGRTGASKTRECPDARSTSKRLGAGARIAHHGRASTARCCNTRPNIREQSYLIAKERIACNRGGVHIRTFANSLTASKRPFDWVDRSARWRAATPLVVMRTRRGQGRARRCSLDTIRLAPVACGPLSGCRTPQLAVCYPVSYAVLQRKTQPRANTACRRARSDACSTIAAGVPPVNLVLLVEV